MQPDIFTKLIQSKSLNSNENIKSNCDCYDSKASISPVVTVYSTSETGRNQTMNANETAVATENVNKEQMDDMSKIRSWTAEAKQSKIRGVEGGKILAWRVHRKVHSPKNLPAYVFAITEERYRVSIDQSDMKSLDNG